MINPFPFHNKDEVQNASFVRSLNFWRVILVFLSILSKNEPHLYSGSLLVISAQGLVEY